MPLPDGFSLQFIDEYANEEGQADVDISSPIFDFVRSIRVYMVRGSQWVSNGDSGDCYRNFNAKLGSYGLQGDYGWTSAEAWEVPSTYKFPIGWNAHCPSVGFRSVFIDWRDYEGQYGWERVDY